MRPFLIFIGDNPVLEMLNVLIVNYNTQKLTECAIKSLNKHTPGCKIYLFDNSDVEPFVNNFNNVTVLDNTKGQLINFDEFLEQYPNRFKSGCSKFCKFGSPKHCYTVDYFMKHFDENFLLMDYDVIIKKDVSELVDDECIFVGEVVPQPLSKDIKRVLPFICYINNKMCRENNVPYFDENYMHGLYKTRESDKYDTGAGFFEHSKAYKHKEIKFNDYCAHFKGGSWNDRINREVGAFKTEDDFLERFRAFWDTSNKKVVYTCISGDYDNLREPKVIDPDFDYICFTDQKVSSNVWSIRPIPESLNEYSQVKRQRAMKTMPHLFLPEYELSVWIDANVEIRGSIDDYIAENGISSENGFFYVGKHPERDCIYDEVKACVKYKKDTYEHMEPQVNIYREDGFPEHFGLPQTTILFRYHNSEDCKRLCEAWFDEIKKYSHRDQLSFTYVCWKLGYNNIVYLSSDIFNCQTFKWWSGHKKTHVTGKYISAATRSVAVSRARNESSLTMKVKKILENRRQQRINGMTLDN